MCYPRTNSSQFYMKLHRSVMACLFIDYLLCSMIILCNLVFVNASIERDDLEVNRKIWSQSIPDATGEYPCGVDKIGAVQCDENNDYLKIHACYCIYWDQDTKKSVVGSCIVTCFYTRGSPFYPIERYSISNGTLFNEAVCSPSTSYADTHREGRFCGRCKPQYGLAAYSYQYTICVPCTDYGYKNWLKYFAVALLPLTVFYFLIVILRVSVASSNLNGIVFALQCLSSPLMQRIFDGLFNARSGSDFSCAYNILSKIVIPIIGVVNLDFFRGVYPSFCLHPQLNIIHILFLDYIVALYPFILIFITYVLLTMYDRNYYFIKLAWKPFKYLLACYQRQWNIRTSLIETFATFILLSSTKILSVSFDLLAFTIAYDEMGTEIKKKFLIYDANIEYFGYDHLPFAVLALLIGFVFVFLPFLLLVLYPCRCFQRCLNCLGWRCQALHIFMDAFQGSYKIEPYDMRYFSAFYLLLRFIFLIILELIPSFFALPTLAITMLLSALIFAIFQPYKKTSQNKSDIAFMLLVALLFMTVTTDVLASYLDRHWLTTAKILIIVSLALIFLYLILMFAWLIFHRILKKLFLKIMNRGSSARSFEAFERSESEIRNYPPLLSSR